MYCVYGNSGRYIHGGPLLGRSVIGGFTVVLIFRGSRFSRIFIAVLKVFIEKYSLRVAYARDSTGAQIFAEFASNSKLARPAKYKRYMVYIRQKGVIENVNIYT